MQEKPIDDQEENRGFNSSSWHVRGSMPIIRKELNYFWFLLMIPTKSECFWKNVDKLLTKPNVLKIVRFQYSLYKMKPFLIATLIISGSSVDLIHFTETIPFLRNKRWPLHQSVCANSLGEMDFTAFNATTKQIHPIHIIWPSAEHQTHNIWLIRCDTTLHSLMFLLST